jgi:hypothetical protein
MVQRIPSLQKPPNHEPRLNPIDGNTDADCRLYPMAGESGLGAGAAYGGTASVSDHLPKFAGGGASYPDLSTPLPSWAH